MLTFDRHAHPGLGHRGEPDVPALKRSRHRGRALIAVPAVVVLAALTGSASAGATATPHAGGAAEHAPSLGSASGAASQGFMMRSLPQLEAGYTSFYFNPTQYVQN